MHPANLLLRFALELAALYGMARFGWHAAQGWWRYALCLLLPLLAAAAWGTFAVPGVLHYLASLERTRWLLMR